MKKYTQAEFDALLRDEGGVKICPAGDYTEVKSFGAECSFGPGCDFGAWCSFGAGCSFGERCSFGAGCSFGERCSFGAWCSFGEQCDFSAGCVCEFGVFTNMLTAGGFDSKGRTTYFFKMKDETINVRCGGFAGTFDEWAAQVRKPHRESRLARLFLLLIPAIRAFF